MRSAGNEGLGTAVSPAAPSGRTASAVEDPRLVRAMEEYRAALEAGLRPDRHEFLNRHAEIAPALAECLEGLELVYAVGPLPGFPAEGSGPAPELPAGGVLGDFRLVREVGRGGMGIVYEAEQVSLGRRVALKVLPFAATLDPKNLQRFRQEAQAAAQLHHTNIVPVFAVGSERGVHFYAMQFIDGQSLAAVICEMRQLSLGSGGSGPGQLSELADDLAAGRWAPARALASAAGETTSPVAALATEHATQSAAFFRTAAHLVVQAAEALEYAHAEGIIHRDIKPANLLLSARGTLWVTDFGLARFAKEVGLTQSGDVVGTLRYMSPEQALAKHGLIDHRTDVYALGATLYELLTLEPPFASRDREELLNQIAFAEPRPLRRRRPDLPADLETVVLKALAKDPAERYATAQELADDLRRFLEYKPIRARRPSLWDQVRKWARRHKLVVGVAAVLLLVAVAVLAVSTVLIWKARERAEAGRRVARRAVDDMYRAVAAQLLREKPGMTEVVREFLEKALAFYEELIREEGDDPVVRREMAVAYQNVGEIRFALGAYDLAADAFRRAVALRALRAAASPADPAPRADLAHSYFRLGWALEESGRPAEAEGPYREALRLREELVGAHGDVSAYRDQLANSYNSLASLQRGAGRFAEAETNLRRVIELLEPIAADPGAPLAGQHLAIGHHNLGRVLLNLGRLPEAEQACRQAVDMLEGLYEESPRATDRRDTLAGGLYTWGKALAALGRPDEAKRAYRRGAELWERLAADFPKVPEFRRDLATLYDALGLLLQNARRPEEAKDAYVRAVDLRTGLAADFPSDPAHQSRLGSALHNLAGLHAAAGDLGEARRLLEQAAEYQRAALNADLGDPEYRRLLCQHCADLAGALLRLGEHAAAVRAAVELPALDFGDGRDHVRAAGLVLRCAPLAENDQRLAPEPRAALAETYRRRALDLVGQALRKGYPKDKLRSNPVFEPLGSRKEFRKLLE